VGPASLQQSSLLQFGRSSPCCSCRNTDLPSASINCRNDSLLMRTWAVRAKLAAASRNWRRLGEFGTPFPARLRWWQLPSDPEDGSSAFRFLRLKNGETASSGDALRAAPSQSVHDKHTLRNKPFHRPMSKLRLCDCTRVTRGRAFSNSEDCNARCSCGDAAADFGGSDVRNWARNRPAIQTHRVRPCFST
jgi:hypothetical protein